MSSASYRVKIASGGRTIVAVEDFSFAQGEITFLFGESGIGKSMLCKAVYGLLDPDELDITVNGAPYGAFLGAPETAGVKQSSFFVFQEPSTHLHPLMLIGEQLREGSIAAAASEEEILGRLFSATDSADLRSILDIYPKPYRPSGGEKQRILLAMAFKKIALLATAPPQPTMFVFDEPTGSLDNRYRNIFLDYLVEHYARRPFTAVIITHDYSIISEIYERHKALANRIHFKELTRLEEGHVALHDFSAHEYLSWLRGTAAQRAPVRATAAAPVLEVGSAFTIFGKERRIYRDPRHTQPADLVIRKGEMVYVKAPSGVGKTTLVKIVMGLYAPQKFSMRLCGMGVTEETPTRIFSREIWGKRAGMVFQHADEALDLEASVFETFKGLPLDHALTRATLRASLQELFEGNVSDAFLAKKVKFLSGGQKQRLNLLRTLILRPDLIILDEPLNGLDFASVRKVISLLEEKKAQGSALLMISHNEEIFDALVDEGCLYYLA